MSTEFPTDYNYLFKIILLGYYYFDFLTHLPYKYLMFFVPLGDPVVGKSYILSQYVREDFDLENKNTIGVEFD